MKMQREEGPSAVDRPEKRVRSPLTVEGLDQDLTAEELLEISGSVLSEATSWIEYL